MKKSDLTFHKHYDPKSIESKWRENFLPKDIDFNFSERENLFIVLIPPPNITAQLHMGHALNNYIQDFILRVQLLHGKKILWIPGADHAGIATQNAVEKYVYESQNKRRKDLSATIFLEELNKWKDKYIEIIKGQLKFMNLICNWNFFHFTMDPEFSKAVRYAFLKFYHDDKTKPNERLIYQGYYLVNWCPRCETALSNEEVEYKKIDHDYLFYLRYPMDSSSGRDFDFEKDKYLVIATTRPETIMADTAVAIHPQFQDLEKLKNEKLRIPLSNECVPIIVDKRVDANFGTGVLKITPAHDLMDFEIAHTHNIDFVSIFDRKGCLDLFAKEYTPGENYKTQSGSILCKNRSFKGSFFERYQGLDRFKVRKAIVKDLEEKGFLEKKEKYSHSVGTCYRCHELVEYSFTKQWFLRMKPLAEPLLEESLKNKITIEPNQYEHIYFYWLKNIRDWCLSRQIGWGHSIPVWHCLDCKALNVPSLENYMEDPKQCVSCASFSLKADPDVLDTWFSSMLWPLAVFGWPDRPIEGNFEYISDFLSTGSEIIYFWVARMIIASVYFTGKFPFRYVYIHSTVCDKQGRKMSKSLGNGIDPLNVIEKYSIDVMRFVLHHSMVEGQPILLSEKDFDLGMRFADKIWNVSRFIMKQISLYVPQNFELIEDSILVFEINNNDCDYIERYIVYKLLTFQNRLLSPGALNITHMLNLKKFYHFFFNDFCDLYLEWIKVSLVIIKDQKDRLKSSLGLLICIIGLILDILFPVMPHIIEEIRCNLFQALHSIFSDLKSFKFKTSQEFKDISNIESAFMFDWFQRFFKDLRMLDQKFNLGKILKSEKTQIVINSYPFPIFRQKYEEIKSWIHWCNESLILSSFLKWDSRIHISYLVDFSNVDEESLILIWSVRRYSIFIRVENLDLNLLEQMYAILEAEFLKIATRLKRVQELLQNRKFTRIFNDSKGVKSVELLLDEEKELLAEDVLINKNIENISKHLNKLKSINI